MVDPSSCSSRPISSEYILAKGTYPTHHGTHYLRTVEFSRDIYFLIWSLC
jgi:hypothetical protein